MKHHPFTVSTDPVEPPRSISVSDVVAAWDRALRGLGPVQVIGELSAFSISRPGHAYFTLTDGDAKLDGMLWRDRVQALPWEPKVGDQVLVAGRAQVYKARGQAKLEAISIFPAGAGLQAAALKALERKLEAEGLFDASRKKPLPTVPRRVGLVSSMAADGLRDFLRSRSLRAPNIPVLIADAPVQGAVAAEILAKRLAQLDATGLCDVIAVVRGGGSAQDLLPFSEEVLVRAVANCSTPVVVGVGHEPDRPIAERAADRRAHTPTHAAELIFPRMAELEAHLESLAAALVRPVLQRLRHAGQGAEIQNHRLDGAMRNRLLDAARGLNHRRQRLNESHPAKRLAKRRQQLADLARRLGRSSPQSGLASARGQWELSARRLDSAIMQRSDHARTMLEALSKRLEVASPRAVLDRGYTLVVDEAGRPITSAADAMPGATVRLSFGDGDRRARIEGDDDGQ